MARGGELDNNLVRNLAATTASTVLLVCVGVGVRSLARGIRQLAGIAVDEAPTEGSAGSGFASEAEAYSDGSVVLEGPGVHGPEPRLDWRQERALSQARRQRRLQSGLGAELALNRLLFGATPQMRIEIVATAWGLSKHRRDPLSRLLRWLRCPDGTDVRNKAALCDMVTPDLDTAAPAVLVCFMSRAGMEVPNGLLPPNPETAPDAAFAPLRQAAERAFAPYHYYRFIQALLTIENERLAALAALGITELMCPRRSAGKAAEARMRDLVHRQGEELRLVLVDDGSYAALLPQPDRDLVRDDGLEAFIQRAQEVVKPLIREEVQRAARQHERWADAAEGRKAPRSCYRRPDNYALLNS